MDRETQSLYNALADCCAHYIAENGKEQGMGATAEFVFPSSFCGFGGHFPNQPILPAIVQLAMVRYLAERLLARPLLLKNIGRAKFMAMIQPDEMVVAKIDLQSREEQHDWCGQFTIERGDKELIATGSIDFSHIIQS